MSPYFVGLMGGLLLGGFIGWFQGFTCGREAEARKWRHVRERLESLGRKCGQGGQGRD